MLMSHQRREQVEERSLAEFPTNWRQVWHRDCLPGQSRVGMRYYYGWTRSKGEGGSFQVQGFGTDRQSSRYLGSRGYLQMVVQCVFLERLTDPSSSRRLFWTLRLSHKFSEELDLRTWRFCRDWKNDRTTGQKGQYASREMWNVSLFGRVWEVRRTIRARKQAVLDGCGWSQSGNQRHATSKKNRGRFGEGSGKHSSRMVPTTLCI